MRFLLTFIISVFLGFVVKAHEVEQMYFELDVQPNKWKATIAFDAAYAVPSLRNDTLAPQPDRSWLYTQSAEQHEAMRKEAERYLRDYIHFEYVLKGAASDQATALKSEYRFPDWDIEEGEQPDFPSLMNGGAYFIVDIQGDFPTESGDFIVRVSSGYFPNLFFSVQGGNAPEKVIKAGETFSILKRDIQFIRKAKSGGASEKSLVQGGQESFSLPTGNGSVDTMLLDAAGNTEEYEVTVVTTYEEFSYRAHLWEKYVIGFQHVIPEGLDHVLFIVAMCMLVLKMQSLVKQSLLFTLAHSITLGLVAGGVLVVGSAAGKAIEIIIALSIVFLCIENCWGLRKKEENEEVKISKLRIALIFVFGLIHGMGFAGALGSYLSDSKFFTSSILMANLGIEVAQVCIILVLVILFRRCIPKQFHARVMLLVSILIAGVAVFMFGQRIAPLLG